MASSNLTTATVALSITVSTLLVVPALFFPEASCLTDGAHYHFCEIGRRPTLLVLLVAVVGLPIVTWMIDRGR